MPRLAAFAEASAAERVRGPAKPWRRRDRGIQYAAADRSITDASGILDRPLSRAMTVFVVRVPGNHVSIFTYSKSPGLLSMPTLGGAIQDAYSPVSVTGFISEAMKSPSAVEGNHSPLRLFQMASSIKTPSGVA